MEHLTQHAKRRSAQRSISEAAIDLVLDYGDVERVNGADSYFFNHRSKRRLRVELGRDGFRRVERDLSIYAVVGDDNRVITVAWRRLRLRRR